jgi:four helix bundle protein
MPFEPKRLKDEKEYLDISTNPEAVAGQTAPKTAERLLGNRSNMSLIQEAPVFQLIYDLMKEIHRARRTFSKSEKYSLGERLEEAALDALLHVIDAGRQKREWKIPAIDAAILSLEKTKIMIRLATDLAEIQEKRALAMQESVQTIGRMLGGWRRSI